MSGGIGEHFPAVGRSDEVLDGLGSVPVRQAVVNDVAGHRTKIPYTRKAGRMNRSGRACRRRRERMCRRRADMALPTVMMETGDYSLRDPRDCLSSGSWSSLDVGQPVRLLGEIDNFPGCFRLFHGGL